MNAPVKLVDLKDRGENPAGAPYDCRLEIDNDDANHAVIVWTETLRFHAELAEADEQQFADINARARGRGETRPLWSELTDENGWLTAAAEEALAVELSKLILKQTGIDVGKVWVTETGSDEPDITFEVVTSYLDDETYEAWLDRVGWPVTATLINVTDPGTFMCPYLFSAILYHPLPVVSR